MRRWRRCTFAMTFAIRHRQGMETRSGRGPWLAVEAPFQKPPRPAALARDQPHHHGGTCSIPNGVESFSACLGGSSGTPPAPPCSPHHPRHDPNSRSTAATPHLGLSLYVAPIFRTFADTFADSLPFALPLALGSCDPITTMHLPSPGLSRFSCLLRVAARQIQVASAHTERHHILV